MRLLYKICSAQYFMQQSMSMQIWERFILISFVLHIVTEEGIKINKSGHNLIKSNFYRNKM